VIDHPILLVENLLKLGKGDKGRLLSLRNSLKNGKTIYDSDKKYLYTMQLNLNPIIQSKHSQFEKNDFNSSDSSMFTFPKNKTSSKISKTNNLNKNNDFFNSMDTEIKSICNSIIDIKTKESKIRDNLELLLINREISINVANEKSGLFGFFFNLPKILRKNFGK